MNAFVGEKISIITSKSQTTRHRIKGIVNSDDFQIVFSDTPGVLKPNYKLQQSMLNFSNSAFADADIIVYVTDVFEKIDKNKKFLERVQNQSVPVLLIINKIDISEQEKVNMLVDKWSSILPKAEIFSTSALEGFNIKNIFNRIIELLPESPPFFPKDQMTDRTERFFVSEIIREKILLNYKKEIPYSVEINVDEFKENDDIIRIRAIIFTERRSQKGIIIGHKGKAIKNVGIAARKDIEAFFDKKVYIELLVKVAENWRNKEISLNKFGYL